MRGGTNGADVASSNHFYESIGAEFPAVMTPAPYAQMATIAKRHVPMEHRVVGRDGRLTLRLAAGSARPAKREDNNPD